MMRIAKQDGSSFERCSEKATGELIDTERVTISSEGDRWKRAEGYLAGGLPYRTYGSNGGDGETCLLVTRPVPTHSRKLFTSGLWCMTDEREILISPLFREPYAVKAARTVLTGGMGRRAYW